VASSGEEAELAPLKLVLTTHRNIGYHYSQHSLMNINSGTL
jgi:hypothetical protein